MTDCCCGPMRHEPGCPVEDRLVALTAHVGQTAEKGYKPGDKALIQFGDGEWRPAELSRGFIWATPDGSHHLAAEGGFDARPLLATAENARRCPRDGLTVEWHLHVGGAHPSGSPRTNGEAIGCPFGSEQRAQTGGMRYLLGNDAMNMLIDIYMDGFMTGASSALATYTNVDDATSDRLCGHLTAGLRGDPLAIETIRREISERFAGIDSGEKSFTIPGGQSDA